MPYTNRERQRQAQHASYLRNKEKLDIKRREIQVRNRKFVRDYLTNHPCVDCGETDIVVLEFDHINDDKVMSVSDLMKRTYSLQRILQEIEKCEVVCANDHRRRTCLRSNSHRTYVCT